MSRMMAWGESNLLRDGLVEKNVKDESNVTSELKIRLISEIWSVGVSYEQISMVVVDESASSGCSGGGNGSGIRNNDLKGFCCIEEDELDEGMTIQWNDEITFSMQALMSRDEWSFSVLTSLPLTQTTYADPPPLRLGSTLTVPSESSKHSKKGATNGKNLGDRGRGRVKESFNGHQESEEGDIIH
ncbi:hypothetical protein Tco_0087223 [Tanacetum coccineum]